MTTPAWWPQVETIFAQQGVPAQYWVPIMAQESGFNPSAIGHGADHSVGLLQLNPVAGQGIGYSMAELQNPVTNVEIGAPYIAQAYHSGVAKGLTGTALAQYTAENSGHYGDQNGQVFWQTYSDLAGGKGVTIPTTTGAAADATPTLTLGSWAPWVAILIGVGAAIIAFTKM